MTNLTRETIQVVELIAPKCAEVYGTGNCTASGPASQKCYNTRATCQDLANYDGSDTLSLYFARGHVVEQGLLLDAPYVIPCLENVSTSPTKINLAGTNPDSEGLGNRALVTIQMSDFPHTDRVVDPYLSERGFDPFDRSRGTFWTRWLVRNRYRQNITIKVYEGYVGQGLSDMTVRQYYLEKADGPNGRGGITLTGKDILAQVEDRKAQAPLASPGELLTDISAGATSFTVTNAILAEYDSSGTLRIDDELMTYTTTSTVTNGVLFSGVTRGTDNSTATTHSAEAAVQQCLRYTDQQVDTIVEDLLTTYGGLPSGFLDTTEWASEVDDFLPSFRMTALITEPESVTQLISELQVQVGFNIWWDERDALVKLRAVRGRFGTQQTISAERDIIAGSFSISELPRERISQCWVYFNSRDFTLAVDDAVRYSDLRIVQNENFYGEESIRKIYGRWLDNNALASTIADQLAFRYRNTPRQAKLRLHAIDHDKYWTGDTVLIDHFRDVDQYGARRLNAWTIISAEEVKASEEVEFVLRDTTDFGFLHFVMASGAADYPGADSVPDRNCYIGNAAGLLSDGRPSGNIS